MLMDADTADLVFIKVFARRGRFSVETPLDYQINTVSASAARDYLVIGISGSGWSGFTAKGAISTVDLGMHQNCRIPKSLTITGSGLFNDKAESYLQEYRGSYTYDKADTHNASELGLTLDTVADQMCQYLTNRGYLRQPAGGLEPDTQPEGALQYLRHTFNKLSAIQTNSDKTFRVFSIGDSVGTYPTTGLLHWLGTALGSTNGSAGSGTFNTFPTTSTAGDTNFFGEYFVVSNAQSFFYLPLTGPTHLYADRIAIPYIASPDAGSFELYISTNGAGFYLTATIDAANATHELKWWQTELPPDYYTYKVVGRGGGTSGRVLLPRAPLLYRNDRVGLALGYLAAGSMTMTDVLAPPSNVIGGLLSNVNPDLVTIFFKDNGQIVSNSLPALYALVTNYAVNADVVLISDYNWTADSLAHNAAMRPFAQANRLFYFDAQSILFTSVVRTNLGWALDGTHLSPVGIDWFGLQLFEALGFEDMLRPSSATNSPAQTSIHAAPDENLPKEMEPADPTLQIIPFRRR
jgi:hypothetical protein